MASYLTKRIWYLGYLAKRDGCLRRKDHRNKPENLEPYFERSALRKC